MPILVQWIIAGLVWGLTSAVGKLFTTIGLAFVISEFVMPDWLSYFAGMTSGAPAFTLELLGMWRVDDAITVVLSAIAARAASGMITGLRRTAAAGVIG